MPKRKAVTFDIVREVGLALPGVEEGTMYGLPALKVRGKLLACLPANKTAEPDSLAVPIDFDERAGLIADGSEAYYVTDHYRNHPIVLVRLSEVRIDQLRDLLGSAWRFVTSQKSGTVSRRPGAGNVEAAGRESKKPV
jgi:hypothetical protein